MNDKLAELLEKLAVKLGTTAEHLWNVLIVQAKFWAYNQIAFDIALLLSSVGCFFLAKKLWKTGEEKEKTNEYLEMNELPFEIGAMIIAITFFILCAILVYQLSEFDKVLGAFFNPEYYALQEVTKMLK